MTENHSAIHIAGSKPLRGLHSMRIPTGPQMAEWIQQGWRPAGTLVVVALALLLGWGVVNGKHGLSAWQQQRAQDRRLRLEVQDLQQENARIRDHIQHLKSDPDAIEHQAREQLHYARPGEVIYALPSATQSSAPADGK
ncbi:MAG: septum formation initiator family protein [Acidobacteriota bacterium]|nr:septum formation initiator family protein [Acidobacteriota bacterium]